MKRAFTLLELLIVIALIGLLVALSVVNMSLLPSEKSMTPKGSMLAAMKRARTDTQIVGAGISLFFDSERRDIVACLTESGVELWRVNLLGEKLPTPAEVAEGKEISGYDISQMKKIELYFLPILPEVVTLSAPVNSGSSIRPLESLRFYPDGSSTPVKIVFKLEDEDAFEYVPDPFSGYRFVSEKTKDEGNPK